MAWRGLHISDAAKLSLRDGQFVVAQSDGETSLPLEDIAFAVLDTTQVSLTGALLAACLAGGVTIIQSDGKHMPVGIALPFHAHYRQSEIAHIQVSASAPLKKRAWQGIVRAKIRNQAGVLAALGRPGADNVAAMALAVASGDGANIEARAARTYWGNLFDQFRRGDEDDRRNALLNYGYAVLRAAISRSLVACGLLPAFGVHHASVTNAFNLADDLIEPFRPFVDYLAFRIATETGDARAALSVADRRTMAKVAFAPVRMDDEEVTLLVAAEMTAQSLVRALRNKDASLLRLPRISTATPHAS